MYRHIFSIFKITELIINYTEQHFRTIIALNLQLQRLGIKKSQKVVIMNYFKSQYIFSNRHIPAKNYWTDFPTGNPVV